MNVSIITMTCTYNYGATLQAFALQSYVEKMGYSCNVINHMGWKGHRTLSQGGLNRDTLLKIPYKKALETGYFRFESFYSNFMHMTRRYDSINDLYECPPNSDLFITGSDQVWNPRDLRKEFYLDFAPVSATRISYAASIGIPAIPEDKRIIIGELLKKINYISVRETSAQQSIQQLTDNEVNKNCDPVYLIDQDEWRMIESPIDDLPNDYILCYMIYKPKWINDWLRKVRKSTGKKIVFVGLNGFRPVECDKYVRCAGPQEFIWLIDHASCVVSSSFHGIAFSVLFGKPLVAIPDPPRPDRINNLLSLFNLQNNILYENKINDIFLPYDFEKITQIIKNERNITNNYFLKVFSEIEVNK